MRPTCRAMRGSSLVRMGGEADRQTGRSRPGCACGAMVSASSPTSCRAWRDTPSGRAPDRARAHAIVLRPGDPALTARLTAELPGILNWALHGYRRLRQRGYFRAAGQRARGHRGPRAAGLADQGVHHQPLQGRPRPQRAGRTALADLARVVRKRRPRGRRHQADAPAATSRPRSPACASPSRERERPGSRCYDGID